MENPYKPIQCHVYDYFELACLKNLSLLVEYKSGEQIKGVAMDVQPRKDKTEWLLLETENGVIEIRLDEIAAVSQIVTDLNQPKFFDQITID